MRTPQVIHRLPGRLRVHFPGWSGGQTEAMERAVAGLPGVERVRASAPTQNVLVQFDPRTTAEADILRALAAIAHPDPRPSTETPRSSSAGARRLAGEAARGISGVPKRAARAPKHAVREVGRLRRRARIAVTGIDRDPELARRVVERLNRMPGVSRVTASQLTGRVMVEYSEHLLSIQDLLSTVARLELPDLPGEDTPSHPLDPAPLVQSTARAVGSGLGLGLVSLRRARSSPQAGGQGGWGSRLAGAIGIIEGLPPFERRLEELIGRDAAQLVLGGMAIVGLTFAGNPLGLAVSGAGALRLMTSVRPRREAWRRYEERLGDAEPPHPGAEAEIESGERLPLPGRVLSGFGTAVSASGRVVPATPGEQLDAGARVFGGPITVKLSADPAFEPEVRATPPRPKVYDRYLGALPPVSLGLAALTAILTRTPSRALTSLLLVNPRAALIGADAADHGAEARVLRQGVTVVGSRERRPICRPDALIVESPRALINGLELIRTRATDQRYDEAQLLRLAAGISAAAGSPWGPALDQHESADAVDGAFDGRVASAEIDGERWLLTFSQAPRTSAASGHDYRLELRLSTRKTPVGHLDLRLVPAPGLDQLLETCRHAAVPIEVIGDASQEAAALLTQHGISKAPGDALDRVHQLQDEGAVVAVLSDAGHAGPEFARCDLAIGLTSGRGGHFAARADLLAADLSAVAAIIEAGELRDTAVRDSVLASIASNLAGSVWGLGGNPRFHRASTATYLAALAAITDGFARLRGGRRARSVNERLSDPQPERVGRLPIEAALKSLGSRPEGLAREEAEHRRRPPEQSSRRGSLANAIVDQLDSPLTMVLAGGGGISLLLGAAGDAAMIAAVIAVNTAVGAWQERQAGRAAEALQELSARTATALRDGEPTEVQADELVPGDVILLAAGDRVPADARLIEADELAVDEAALTGESVPVEKTAEGGTDSGRIVLEGSDVVVGTARAAVIAVGSGTRMGATAAAITLEETNASPLGRKLGRMFQEGLPIIIGGGLLVTAGGLLWGRPLMPQLALGASVAIGAVPEGLPLLAGVAQAAVARRLGSRNALVRRLSAVEALGRVDVVCTDKTGTLTEGRPAVTAVSSPNGDSEPLEELGPELCQVLETAALASPAPDSPNLASHPTDLAVVQGAERAGLKPLGAARREEEVPFEPSRGFHATRARGRLFVKGATEELAGRCTKVRNGSDDGQADRDALLEAATQLSGQGLRVLMVAEGDADASADDPQGLTAVGFIGISDPLRGGVAEAVRRCETAGVRVVMLTGDHPATAQAIAHEAGLARNGADVLTGPEVAALGQDELAARLEHTRVIARISPLDKLRIVEVLQQRGHVVSMTGDGVNDAPALRLADVGVAMGRGGTDVAREAADVVLAEDDFATLVEAFVEGRGFWHNIRRALSLLLGGNLGELGLMIAAGACGLDAPLNTRQVLTVNLVTDVLPALSVAIQHPEHRDLASLSREGTEALDAPLRRGILTRGLATSLPSFLAYLMSSRQRDPARRRAVSFTSIVVNQLAQTLDVGRAEGRLSREVLAAVAGSGLFVAASVALPPLRGFLGLAPPTPFGLLLCGASAVSSVALSRLLNQENPSTN